MVVCLKGNEAAKTVSDRLIQLVFSPLKAYSAMMGDVNGVEGM